MADDDTPPPPPPPVNTVDRVFALLDDMEQILKEVRALAQHMKEER